MMIYSTTSRLEQSTELSTMLRSNSSPIRCHSTSSKRIGMKTLTMTSIMIMNILLTMKTGMKMLILMATTCMDMGTRSHLILSTQ